MISTDDIIDISRGLRLGHTSTRLLCVLHESLGEWVLTEEIMDRLYSGAGACAQSGVVKVLVHRLRPRLLAHGLTIESRIGATGGYKLERDLTESRA